MLNREQIHRMHPECFSGVVEFKNYEYLLKLEDNAKSVLHLGIKIALVAGGKLEKEH